VASIITEPMLDAVASGGVGLEEVILQTNVAKMLLFGKVLLVGRRSIFNIAEGTTSKQNFKKARLRIGR
jgi:hypothetical protein